MDSYQRWSATGTSPPLPQPVQDQLLSLTSHSSGMSLNELFERNGHLFLHGAGSIDMARDTEELGRGGEGRGGEGRGGEGQ